MVLGVVAIITTELSVSTASSVSFAVSSANIVDRSQKGDRLQLAHVFSDYRKPAAETDWRQ